jgi:hypothetical protein
VSGVARDAQRRTGYAKAVLTLVLRSTHSSQLSVGLFRFCFFLGGASRPCRAPVGGSGLVDDWAVPSLMAGLAHPLESGVWQLSANNGNDNGVSGQKRHACRASEGAVQCNGNK